MSLPLTQQAHAWIESKMPTFDTGLDATLGNGWDLCFLAKHCQRTLFGFDIQSIAIKQSRSKLSRINYNCEVQLIEDSHAHLSSHIKGAWIDVAIFNLGYLPSGNKRITTTSISTCKALTSLHAHMKQGGLLTVLCYPGHPQGKKETQDVLDTLTSWSQHGWHLECRKGDHPLSPVLWLCEKTL